MAGIFLFSILARRVPHIWLQLSLSLSLFSDISYPSYRQVQCYPRCQPALRQIMGVPLSSYGPYGLK